MKRLLSRQQEIVLGNPFESLLFFGNASFVKNTGKKIRLVKKTHFDQPGNVLWCISKNWLFSWRVKKKKIFLFEVILVLSLTPAPEEFQKQLEWSNLSNEYVCVQCLHQTPAELGAWLTPEWNEHTSIKCCSRPCPSNWISVGLWVCSISPVMVL